MDCEKRKVGKSWRVPLHRRFPYRDHYTTIISSNNSLCFITSLISAVAEEPSYASQGCFSPQNQRASSGVVLRACSLCSRDGADGSAVLIPSRLSGFTRLPDCCTSLPRALPVSRIVVAACCADCLSRSLSGRAFHSSSKRLLN